MNIAKWIAYLAITVFKISTIFVIINIENMYYNI